MDARPLLELAGIAKAFGSRLLFRRVNLALLPGTLSLLAGPNGAGKSTLMRVMAGLTPPDAGSVERRVPDVKLGYMAHAPFLYPGLTALENLLFWAKAARLERAAERAQAALETVGLARHAHEFAGIFSRGMAQRLNLARLLLPAPELILLDEPATGLDTASRRILLNEMLKARENGAAIVWISHDVEEDSRHADRIFVLRDRTVCESGGASC
ncbi:ABC transporter ATP-binding protein [uncultured Mailhella sp.]|uniref:ABC transporter ATP-binding protein n=1 Tax=uncultured Mailhella sp. TaxID=1981031 RepID=UPI00261BEE11|nr:ABC transporter ATP-binding protein [uncultured Mailhella sp.]